MVSTVTSSSGRTGSSSLGSSQAYRQQVAQMTQAELQYYPQLAQAPGALFALMITWIAESRIRLYPLGGDSAKHGKATIPEKFVLNGQAGTSNGFIYSDYWNTPVIQNEWNNGNSTIRSNIEDGFWPWGISACMGAYMVAGCKANSTFRAWAATTGTQNRIAALGLEVQPGQSINETLFPADTPANQLRSIAQGIIVMSGTYNALLKYHYPRLSPTEALSHAVGSYVGPPGAVDVNGYGYSQRVSALQNTEFVQMAAAVGVTNASNQVAVNLNNPGVSTNVVSVVNNPAPGSAPTTNSNSNGVSADNCDASSKDG